MALQSYNKLLSAVREEIFVTLQPYLKLVPLRLGDVISRVGSQIRQIYFPHSGAISLVVELSAGTMIETAMVGNDGVLNATAALDGKVSLNKAIVQLEGVSSVIEASRLSVIADNSKPLRSLLIRHDQVLFAQAQQSAACNASHSVESRMCRGLLRMRDLADRNGLTLTQDFLAQMLGVRRPSVSIIAQTLQEAGLIKYSRGKIHILDASGLGAEACECYEAVKSHYKQLFA